jgi:hypothetical protein
MTIKIGRRTRRRRRRKRRRRRRRRMVTSPCHLTTLFGPCCH